MAQLVVKSKEFFETDRATRDAGAWLSLCDEEMIQFPLHCLLNQGPSATPGHRMELERTPGLPFDHVRFFLPTWEDPGPL